MTDGAGHMEIYDAPTDSLLDSQHRDPLLRHLTRTIVAAARRHAPPPGSPPAAVGGPSARDFDGAAIDIGCGVGRTSLALAEAGYAVVGVDPSARAVELAAATADARGCATRTKFVVGDATADPPSEWIDRFPVAVCSEVIEHVTAPERVVDYARHVLRPGGILILTTPHDRRLWTAMDTYAGHVTRFTAAELRALLWDFDVLEIGTEGFPFQRIVMRTYDRALSRSGRAHTFGAIGNSPAYRAYTAVMPWLLRVDHWFRGMGKGMTLVVVARRRVIVG
jgi:SAM-dependent methyltransferase